MKIFRKKPETLKIRDFKNPKSFFNLLSLLFFLFPPTSLFPLPLSNHFHHPQPATPCNTTAASPETPAAEKPFNLTRKHLQPPENLQLFLASHFFSYFQVKCRFSVRAVVTFVLSLFLHFMVL